VAKRDPDSIQNTDLEQEGKNVYFSSFVRTQT
jgi:hypothetical protein